VGSNNRVTVRVTVGPSGGYGTVGIGVTDADDDHDYISVSLSGSGQYQFPFSVFESDVDFTRIEEVYATVLGRDITIGVNRISATNGAEFTLLYDVWQPTTFVACGPARAGGAPALRWHWGVGTSNPQVIAGSQLLVNGVGGANCTNVTFQAADSGGGLGQLGEMARVSVDWAGNTFDNAAFEMNYSKDPGAPFDVTLVGDPVVDSWDTGFVIRHQVRLDDVVNAPDGTATQEFVVTPYPGQEIYFDYVEAIPLPLEEGG
jgi:hypothetical protein